jgi:hypothetical protein
VSPKHPLGATPSPPIRPAAASERISPYIYGPSPGARLSVDAEDPVAHIYPAF